jgi:hypothetical protein
VAEVIAQKVNEHEFDGLKTVEEFAKVFADLFGGFSEQVRRLGALIKRAEDTLSVSEYKRLKQVIRDGENWSESMFEAAAMVQAGTLDACLIVSGVSVDKIMKLSKKDQHRLASGVKIGVKRSNGDVDFKRWGDMTSEEVKQVIGVERIIPPDEQKPKGAKGNKKVTVFNKVRYDHREKRLALSNGNVHGEITLPALRALLEEDEWEHVKEDVLEESGVEVGAV